MNNWLKVALLSALPAFAHAHTMSPYLLPEVFDVTSSNVTFQSGITVEKFFVPSSNFKTSYVVTAPDGKQTTVEPSANLKRFSIAEFDVTSEGTYRIQTKDAAGNAAKYAKVDGRWLRVRPARPANAQMPAAAAPAANANPAPQPPATNQIPRVIAADQVPANAETLDVANVYIAESYITKGKPSTLPALTNKGLELKLNSHPNELYAGDALKVQVLFNGKPVSGVEVDVYKGASSYQPNAKREQPHVTTDKDGKVEIKVEQAGIYLIATSYPEANPDNTQKPNPANYTYSLTLEVTE